jgi:hypothetical protein
LFVCSTWINLFSLFSLFSFSLYDSSWKEVVQNDRKLSLEKFKQAILIGKCPLLAQYNTALLFERERDFQNTEKAMKLLLEVIHLNRL